jgi:hypothetical protein
MPGAKQVYSFNTKEPDSAETMGKLAPALK